MRLKNITIKGRIFFVYIMFAIVLLAVLWFFQIVYLDDFYKMIKTSETEAVLDDIENTLNTSDNIARDIELTAACNNLAIYITDCDGNALYNAEYISNSQMSSLPDYMFKEFYSEAVDNGGEAVIEYKGSEMQKKATEEENAKSQDSPDAAPDVDENGKAIGQDGKQDDSADVDAAPSEETGDASDSNETADSDKVEDSEAAEPSEDSSSSESSHPRLPYTVSKEPPQFRQNIGDDLAESVIYVRIRYINKVEHVIMVNSVLTPVDATVTTLKSQLLIITLIMIAVALLIATYFSRSIGKSIVVLNDGAKRLAEGNYDVTFDSRDYKEVSELSDTLNYAASELAKTDSLQKELIANVSHDLRTPLTMIKGYAEVMRDIPGENTPENVQVIIEETERLTGLVNDMLDISKLKAKTVSIKPEMYNITESIRHVLERYNKLREASGYTIDFVYDQEVEVYADEQKMFQVIYNLVNNAINYTGEDKKVTVIQKVSDDILRIEVKDTGNGVAPEDIPYVWDRYYKDKKAHKRAIQGTGLGLSIVKSVLELHGAKYGVASVQGQGATFWFEIPLNPFEE